MKKSKYLESSILSLEEARSLGRELAQLYGVAVHVRRVQCVTPPHTISCGDEGCIASGGGEIYDGWRLEWPVPSPTHENLKYGWELYRFKGRLRRLVVATQHAMSSQPEAPYNRRLPEYSSKDNLRLGHAPSSALNDPRYMRDAELDTLIDDYFSDADAYALSEEEGWFYED